MAVNVAATLSALALLLVAGSVIRVIRLQISPLSSDRRRNRLASLVTWWALFVLLVLISCFGAPAAIVVCAAISLLGLREFRLLAQQRIEPIQVWWRLTYLAVPIHYLCIYLSKLDLARTFIPVWAFGILLVRLLLAGRTMGFLETAGITFLGLLMTVFLFSHATLLFTFPPEANATGGVGLFLFLVVLTEGNDIAQAQWGQLLGRRKITPEISPNKTWEGFLLGAATTVALSLALGRYLTPFDGWVAAAAGLMIAVGGFLGDITMSAIKRAAGVKDSGTILPGQGGVLDRFDSLIFTAPLLYYFTDFILRGGVP